MSTTIALEQIRIASPCTARWEDMVPVGDGARARHCGQCGLDVHDLSAMTREEAETFLAGAERSPCVRLHKRADGRVITRDCPVGLRAARVAMRRMAGRAVAALAVVFTGAALAAAKWQGGGGVRIGAREPFVTMRAWMGLPPAPRQRLVVMGMMACPSTPVVADLVAEVKALREEELTRRRDIESCGAEP